MTRTRLSLASGAGSEDSLVGLIGAVLLHLAIIGVTLFTWEHRLDIAQQSPPVVPIDLVTIGQKTNIAPEIRREPKMEPLPVPQQPPPTMTAQTPPLPQPDKSELAPQPEAKPVPKPQPEKPKDDKLAAILNQYAAPQPEKPEKKTSKDKLAAILNQYAAPQNARNSSRSHAGAGAQTAMTADLATYFFNKVRPCWYIGGLAGAPNPETLVVQIVVSLNPDGSVASPPQLTAQSAAGAIGNRYLKATADSAIRAITQCAPFKLPPDRYAEWRQSTVNFSPQQFAQ